MHLAHAEAVNDFVFIRDDLGLSRHHVNHVCFGDPLLPWLEVGLVNFIQSNLVGIDDSVRLVAPPYIVSEFLPFSYRAIWVAVVF